MKKLYLISGCISFVALIFSAWLNASAKEYSCVLISRMSNKEEYNVVNVKDQVIRFKHDAYRDWETSAFMFKEIVNGQPVLRGTSNNKEYMRAFIDNKIAFMIKDKERGVTLYIGHCKENK
ncbi:hypothetical protein AT520_003934 [Escherichia coli]|nr:hypothetical protein [Escherichia coli]EJK2350150.1 hypothetical protein [Escherichia coli]HBA9627094.1 hypothetical protein [Escherichia coli]